MKVFCLILITSGFLVTAGCGRKIEAPPPEENAQAAPEQPAAAQQKPQEKVVGRAAIVNMNNQNKGNIGKQTQIVVDFHAAMKDNPELKKMDPKFKAKKTRNPYALVADIAVKKSAQVSRFGMIQMVNAHKAEHGRFPTYEEFMQIMRETGSGFAKLPEYQTYAYDYKTGEISVLIDDEKKQQLIDNF